MLNKKFVPLKYVLTVLGCLGVMMWPVRGQVLPAASPVLAPTPAPTAALTPTPGLQALPQTPGLSPTPAPPVDITPTPTPIVRNPLDEPGDPRRSTDGNWWLDSYPLNDLSQYLAHEAGFQFFQNPQIADVTVTGELFKRGDALEALRALALQYNLVFYQKGRTIFLLTQDQFHSPSFFSAKRYHLRHQLAEYLLQPIADFLGIVVQRAATTFPGYPIPNTVSSATLSGSASGGASGNSGSASGSASGSSAAAATATSTGNQESPRWEPGFRLMRLFRSADLLRTLRGTPFRMRYPSNAAAILS